jgi:hypothetical protein
MKWVKLILTLVVLAIAFSSLTAYVITMFVPQAHKTTVGTGTGDLSLQTWQPCAPPCWYNIVPGRSTAAEVRQILPALPFIADGSIEETRVTKALLEFRWRYTDPWNEDGIISLQNDIVVSIYGRPGFKLELREVVNRFGPPNGIIPFRVGGGDQPPYYTVGLFYPDKGLSFGTIELPVSEVDTKQYPVKPDYIIGNVYYCEPGSLEQLMESISPYYVSVWMKRMQPWQGFGTFPFPPTPTAGPYGPGLP